MNAETSLVLTCPSCRTRYQAASARFLPSGRNVRCVKCGQVWFQPAPNVEPDAGVVAEELRAAARSLRAEIAEDPTPELREDAPPRAPAPKAKRPVKQKRAHRIHLVQVAAWAVLLIMIGGIGWSAVQYRQFIATVWPQSASVYAAIGMPVNVRGMTLEDVSYAEEMEDGLPVLSVTGRVVNVSNYELPVPGLRAVLTDDFSREVYRWTFSAGVSTLKAGADNTFMTRLSSPPANARGLKVTFADGEK